MTLQTYIQGEPAAVPPLLVAHGLFGSGRNWGVIAKRLADERQVIAVDMRNHGYSPWFDTHSYLDQAGDLAAVIESLGQPVDIIGHSMGGKAAMVLALTRPELLRKAIIADIAPVTYSHSQMGPLNAMRGVDLTGIESRSDAAAQMTGIEDALKPFLLQSLDLKERRWRLNLDVLAEEMPKIIGFPQLDGSFRGPALFLSGADSAYVRREDRDAIRSRFTNTRFAQIPGAGHWLHAEKPREFEAACRYFLNA